MGAAKSSERRSQGQWARLVVAGFVLLMVGAIWGGIALTMNQTRSAAEAEAISKALGLVRAVEEHTISAVRAIDQLVRLHKAEYEFDPRRYDISHPRFKAVALGGPFVQIGLIDADGYLLSTNVGPISGRTYLGDREHFKVHVEQDGGELFIGKPLVGRASGKASIQFARRMNKPDGSFAGVAVVSVDPAYFTKFYESIEVGAKGAVLLLGREDGIVRARSAFNETNQGQDMRGSRLWQELQAKPHGVFTTVTAIDGTTRIVAYRTVTNLPLVVGMGLSLDDVLEPLDRLLGRALPIGLLATVVVLAMAGLLLWEVSAIERGATELSAKEGDLIAHRDWLRDANEALARSEFQARAVIEAATDGILTIDEQGLVATANPAAEKIFGRNRGNMVGTDIRRLIPEIVFPPPSPSTLEHSPVRSEIAIERSGQDTVMIEYAVSDRRAEGLYAYVVVARDITQRRNNEDNLRKLSRALEQIPTAVIITDLAGQVYYVNPRFTVMTGYTASDLAEAGGERTRRILLPGVQAAAWDSVLTGGEWWGEFVNLRKNGIGYWERTGLSIIRDEFGNPTHVLAIKEDISARKDAETNLAERTVELERSNAELEEFAYVASHDLQEPLRMVTNYTQMLQRRYREKLDAQADEYIEYAVGGAKRMQGLITDLLEYARVGRDTDDGDPVKLDDIVSDIRQDLAVAIAETKATVEVAPLPQVRASRRQMTRLLQNLIGNAIKYHQPGRPPLVQIGAERRGEQWVFWVRDNGLGIEPVYFEKIFKVFQRLHGRDAYSGSGIGLAICRKVVMRLGGRIWVESASGAGSTFLFSLPTARVVG